MAGCGRCPEPWTATTDGSGGTVQACPPPSEPNGEVVTAGGHPTAAHVRLAGTVLVGVSAHRSTRPAAGHHAGRTSAQRSQCRWLLCSTGSDTDRRCGTGAGHLLSAERPADRRCPAAQRPAAMTAEAAAEGLQRFRPGSGNGTGAGHLTAGRRALLDTPSARRTTWRHTGQDAGSSGRSIRRSLTAARSDSLQLPLLFLKAGACGGRHRP
jgi:hypothetical protein